MPSQTTYPPLGAAVSGSEVSTGRRIRFVSIGVKGDWAFARKASGLESWGFKYFPVFL